MKALLKLCVIPQKDVKGDGTIRTLLQIYVYGVFFLLNKIFLVISGILMVGGPIVWFVRRRPSATGLNLVVEVCLGFFTLTLSRAFRIASFEVTNIEDCSYLLGLFTCFVSTASMVIAAVSLFMAWK